VPAVKLGAVAIAEALRRAGLQPDQVDEVIMGMVLSAGVGQGPARQAAMAADIPVATPATTVNKVCGSGLKAVMLAAQAIANGDAEVVIAGGQENMSQSPHLLPGSRDGWRMGDVQAIDSMIRDGLWDAFNRYHMGTTAENVARKHGVTREQQDRFAVASQNKAEAAQKAGKFADEIVAFTVKTRKGDTVVDQDEYIRHGATIENMQKLRPAFTKDGSVTAANASGINDGAAAALIVDQDRARSLGWQPRAAIVASAWAGVEPEIMGLGPVDAVRKLCAKMNVDLQEFELVELNEAFAAQALPVLKDLDLLGVMDDKVNLNGGAIALGHPLGATGTRLVYTLLRELHRRGGGRGLATACIGGGQGIAMCVEVDRR